MNNDGDRDLDAFPREQATDLVKRLPSYAKLALAIARDESVPASRRAALAGAGTYVVSPIGLVPGFIPLVGQLDDLWVLLRALHFALDGLSPDARADHIAAVELTEAQIEDDYAAVSELIGWTARRGRSLAVRAAAGAGSFGRRISEQARTVRTEVQQRLAERSDNG